MTILRPSKMIGYPMQSLANHCDICGKPRTSGDNSYKHTKCSKIRQARYAALRGEK